MYVPTHTFFQTTQTEKYLRWLTQRFQDELRSLTACGKKLLCSLVARQQIPLNHLPDSSRMDRLWLYGECLNILTLTYKDFHDIMS